MKPATPLPWNLMPSNASNLVHIEAEHDGAQVCSIPKKRIADAEFIYRACNSYPRLVEALRKSVRNHCADDKMFCSTCSPARKLLVELGEAKPQVSAPQLSDFGRADHDQDIAGRPLKPGT